MKTTSSGIREIESLRFAQPVSYEDAFTAQIKRRTAIQEGHACNTLFLLEHTPVITLGRDADTAHLLRDEAEIEALGIDVCPADRGGDVTYHGPGQLVAYPVLRLGDWKRSINWYLRALEEVLIRVLAEYGLEGERVENLTGVWVEGAKVAAIGVGIHKWVTYHGIALNVNPDPGHWGLIVPCGIADRSITSLKQLLGTAPPMAEVTDRFERCFRGHFVNEWTDAG